MTATDGKTLRNLIRATEFSANWVIKTQLVQLCYVHNLYFMRLLTETFKLLSTNVPIIIIIICTLFTKYWNKVCKLPKFTTQVVSQICKKGY